MTQLDRYDRALAWARERGGRVGRHNPWEITLRVVRASVEDRLSGLAAEMAFFALLSLVPLFVTIGAALGYAELLIGPEQVARAQDFIVRGLSVVFSPRVTDEVLAPLIRALLTQQRGGLALGGLVVTLYLASRVFTATIRSLDQAYRVPERRPLAAQRLLAVGLSLGFVVVVVVTLSMMVIGPLLGGGESLAARLGLGELFEFVWDIGRWPALVAVILGFLTCVYRFGPNIDTRWRHCLPGAVLGLALWALASVGLRVYLARGGGGTGSLATEDEALLILFRAVGAVVGTIVWTYLTGLSILVGGALNAELARD